MAKKITARVGSYTNGQGEQKGRFVEIGAIGVGQNGKEYVLISPTVDLGGVLQLQNIEAAKEGKGLSDRIICSFFDNDNQGGGYGGGQQQPQQNYQQPNQAPQSNYNQVPHAQQGSQQPHQQQPAPNRSEPAPSSTFDDDIPF